MEKREPRRRVEGWVARRKDSSGVGRRDSRKLDGLLCRGLVSEVGVGDVGCLGVLPLRRMGADEEEDIGRDRCCKCVFLMVWGRSRNRYRCHCDSWLRECQREFWLVQACQATRNLLALVLIRHLLRMFWALYLHRMRLLSLQHTNNIESPFRINCPSMSQTNISAKHAFPDMYAVTPSKKLFQIRSERHACAENRAESLTFAK